jgi:hypothetical protein
MPWKNVCYAGYDFIDDTNFETMLNAMIANKITHLNLEFIVINNDFTIKCYDSINNWCTTRISSLPSGNTITWQTDTASITKQT